MEALTTKAMEVMAREAETSDPRANDMDKQSSTTWTSAMVEILLRVLQDLETVREKSPLPRPKRRRMISRDARIFRSSHLSMVRVATDTKLVAAAMLSVISTLLPMEPTRDIPRLVLGVYTYTPWERKYAE